MRNTRVVRPLSLALFLVLVLPLSGCLDNVSVSYVSQQTAANTESCGKSGCHPDQVSKQAAGPHSAAACTECHAGTGDAHANGPKAAIATTDWTIGGCAGCHAAEAETYLYDDNAQVGPFGGSQRVPLQPKTATFPLYNTIIAGHGFSKEYSEEGAHRWMLEDHIATTRTKYETCLQCKSSKVAYSWLHAKPLRVETETVVPLTHTAAPGVPAKTVTIPKGTVLTYRTDPVTRQVDAKATMPDGTAYSSKPGPNDDAALASNMIWASTVAAIAETEPYGAGCNHCHDPHSGEMRLLRQSMLQSVAGKNGAESTGGVNPYASHAVKDIDQAWARDRRILSCAQCHVEYTCGKSGVDKVDRDAYGWAKAIDLHRLYAVRYDYKQDWVHAIIGQPLIKSQHPETELYWESVHYAAGASCSDCHMPRVERGGRTFRSHWFTSPYKYRDPNTWAAFAAATKVENPTPVNPCTQCHSDRTDRAIGQQQAFYAAQAEVERLLAQSVAGLGVLKAAGKDSGKAYDDTLAAHRKAHSIWENLAVSENSMGFHNFEEAMASMAEAKAQVTLALEKEAAAAQ